MQGTVKWFNPRKGYGFVKGDDEQDYFVHMSQLNGQRINPEDRVEFDGADTDKGKQAQNIKVLGAGAPPAQEQAPEESATEEPATEESVTKEPVAEEATTEESVTKEPVSEEATTEESVTKEPVAEEATPEESVTKEPVAEEATPEAEEPSDNLDD